MLLGTLLILIFSIRLSIELKYCGNVTELNALERCFVHDYVVNPHDFEYIINPGEHICGRSKGADIFLLVYVHTAPKNYKRRIAIRETWSNRVIFKNMRVVFMMGDPIDNSTNDLVKYESDLYGDIVQENFIDAYRNMTYKAIMAMKWISAYCLNVKHILKVDDDVFVNTFTLMDDLKAENNTIRCFVHWKAHVFRNPHAKWHVTKEEFPSHTFGDYCAGGAYTISTDLPTKFYNLSLYTQYFWIDDYYLTGLLAHLQNTRHDAQNSMHIIFYYGDWDIDRKFYFAYLHQSVTRYIQLFYVLNFKFITKRKGHVVNDRLLPYVKRTTRIYKWTKPDKLLTTIQSTTQYTDQINSKIYTTNT